MILLNEMDKLETISKKDYRVLLQLLNPFAPHITEEINEICHLGNSFVESDWPVYDAEKVVDDNLEIGVQVNGKLRATIHVKKDEKEDVVLELAMKEENVLKHIEGKSIVKKIVVPNRIVNIVVK